MTIAQRIKELYDNLVVALNTANEFITSLPNCYDAVEAKGGTIPAQPTADNLPQAILDIPATGLPTDGSTFVTGADEGSFATPFATNGITHLIDNSTTTITCSNFLNYMTNLKIVELNELTSFSIPWPQTIGDGSGIEEFYVPKCTSTGTYDRRYGFLRMQPTIKKIEWGQMVWQDAAGYGFNSPFGLKGMSSSLYMHNLIDFKVAQGWTTANNVTLNLSTWMANNITSADDLATLNSNIVNHFVNTYGGSGTTITLSTELVAKLTQTTLDAFAAKNLTIAAV